MIKKKIVIFVGPSGTGKGTVEEILFKDKSLNLEFSISATTRKKRVGEIEGKHYFFIDKKQFEEGIKTDQFLEYDHHLGNYYGTLWSEIDRIHQANKIPFLEIETEGVKFIMNMRDKNPKWDFDYLSIFLKPPSIDELRQRILNRKSEDEESIKIRLKKAEDELKEIDKYRFTVVNDDAERAAKEIADIIKKEAEK
ncbi:guanylate kinase [Mycoplasmopsis agassizii]|uniref:guanylate kinase n=1 Tax=Mycoplasmopsis agassizii TaxID=33922 RepID=UPI003526C8DE